MLKTFLMLACMPFNSLTDCMRPLAPWKQSKHALAALLLHDRIVHVATRGRTGLGPISRNKAYVRRMPFLRNALLGIVGSSLPFSGTPAAASDTNTVGSVNAPPLVLPIAASATMVLPASILIASKQSKSQSQSYEAPSRNDGHLAQHADAFAVLNAGAKGRGLFATKRIQKDTFLFDYTGDLLSQSEYAQRYPNQISDYCAALRNPSDGVMTFIDGVDEVKGHPARWMNHDDITPNVWFRSVFESGMPPRILMYSLRDIDAGEELEWNYGKGYWAAHKGRL